MPTDTDDYCKAVIAHGEPLLGLLRSLKDKPSVQEDLDECYGIKCADMADVIHELSYMVDCSFIWLGLKKDTQ